jgi:hypothetical protein
MASTISVPGLSKVEELELREALAPGSLEVAAEEAEDHEMGEVLTATVIVTAAAAALRVLAAFLCKNRKEGNTVSQVVEIELPDGTKFKETVEVTTSSEEKAESEVFQKLQDLVSTAK